MGDISEMILGKGANDLFTMDLIHMIKKEPFEEVSDDPSDWAYLPEIDDGVNDILNCIDFNWR